MLILHFIPKAMEDETFTFNMDTSKAFFEVFAMTMHNKATLKTILQTQIDILESLNPGSEAAKSVTDALHANLYDELAYLANRYPEVAESLKHRFKGEKG